MADLADIIAQLDSGNAALQSQAFAALIAAVRAAPPSNKERKKLETALFNCMSSYGPFVGRLCETSLPYFVEDGCLKLEDVLSESTIRLSHPQAIQSCVQLIFRLKKGSLIETAIYIIRREKAAIPVVIEYLLGVEDSKEKSEALIALFVCSDVSESEKISIVQYLQNYRKFDDLGRKFRSPFYKPDEDFKYSEYLKVIETIPAHAVKQLSSTARLDEIDPFLLASRLVEIPEILANGTFPTNRIFLPVLLLVHQSWNEVAKAMPGIVDEACLAKCKSLLIECKANSETSKSSLSSWSTDFYGFFKAVSSDDADGFIELWLNSSLEDVNNTSVLLSIALLPYLKKDCAKCLRLIGKLLEKVPESSNMVFQLYLLLATQPYFAIERNAVMNAMKALLSFRHLVGPLVRLLVTLAQRSSTNDRITSMKILEEVISRHSIYFDQLLPLMTFSDDEGLLDGKIGLMKSMFLATDQSDPLLPVLNDLLKKSGNLLASAVEVLIDVCQNDIIDLGAVKRQLSSKIQQAGNEAALQQFCKLLGVSNKLTVEDDENARAELQALRKDCITDLWKYAQLKRESSDERLADVRATAWTVLSSFPIDLVREVIPIDTVLTNVFDEKFYGKGHEIEGVSTLIRSLLQFDLEVLPRPLYSRDRHQTDVYFADAGDWYETLSKEVKDAAFWASTLKIFPEIVESTALSKRELVAGKVFRKLLHEVPAPSPNTSDQFSHLTAWNLAVSQIFNILAAGRSGDYQWARERIREMCSQALIHIVPPFQNVVYVITALAMVAKENEDERCIRGEAGSPDFPQWINSIAEFVTSIASGNTLNIKTEVTPVFKISKTTPFPKDVIDVAIFCDSAMSRIFDVVLKAANIQRRFHCETQDKDVLNELNYDAQFTGSVSKSALENSTFDEGFNQENDVHALMARLDVASIDIGSIKEILQKAPALPASTVATLRPKLVKVLKRAWSNKGEEAPRELYAECAEMCFRLWSGDRETLPKDYSYLPETSSLRIFVDRFVKPESKDRALALLNSLVPLKRTDGKTLPPLDWQSVLSRHTGLKFEDIEPSILLSIIRLACQERSKKFITKLLLAPTIQRLSDDALKYLAEHFEQNFGLFLPYQLDVLLPKLDEYSRKNGSLDEFVLQLSPFLNHPSVSLFVSEKLPKFNDYGVDDAFSPYLKLVEGSKIASQIISSILDFWSACGTNDANYIELSSFFTPENSKQNVILQRIMGQRLTSSARNVSVEDAVDILLNISPCNVNSKNMNPIYSMILTVICAVPSPIPMNWFSSDLLNLMEARLGYYWNILISSEAFEKNIKKIIRCLVSLLSHSTNEQQKTSLKELLIATIATHPPTTLDLIEVYRPVWDNILVL